ncbi:MAG: hypothetical protein ACREE4_14550 [Stellaceae bacterium]
MKAVVFQGIGDIRLEDAAEPRIEQPTDAIVTIRGAGFSRERAAALDRRSREPAQTEPEQP